MNGPLFLTLLLDSALTGGSALSTYGFCSSRLPSSSRTRVELVHRAESDRVHADSGFWEEEENCRAFPKYFWHFLFELRMNATGISRNGIAIFGKVRVEGARGRGGCF